LGVADLLLAKATLDDFHDPLAYRVFLALIWYVRALDRPAPLAATPDLELVIQDLTLTGDLDELGGRDAVLALVHERPALRKALASLRAAAARFTRVQDEPLVRLAAVELEAELAVPSFGENEHTPPSPSP
jgi:hypothetical protein